MVVRDACPGCGSTQFKKNGHIHSGKQNHQGKVCGRQFVASAEDRIIADEQGVVYINRAGNASGLLQVDLPALTDAV
jgi:hypothetical protein